MAWALLAGTLGSATVVAIGWLGFVGKLPRNRLAGIRTSYTLANDERWYAVHRSGGPVMLLGAIAALAAGLAFLPFALAGKVGDALAAGVLIAMAVMLATSALGGWLYGVSRAKSQGL